MNDARTVLAQLLWLLIWNAQPLNSHLRGPYATADELASSPQFLASLVRKGWLDSDKWRDGPRRYSITQIGAVALLEGVVDGNR